MISSSGMRALFEIAVMGVRLFLMGVSVLAFWALVPACMIWLFSKPEVGINSPAIGLWLLCAIIVAVFNFRLMWHRFDYGEWRNLVAYALTSLAIVGVSPFYLPVYGDL